MLHVISNCSLAQAFVHLLTCESTCAFAYSCSLAQILVHSRTHTLAYVQKSLGIGASTCAIGVRKNLRTYARTCALTQTLAHVGLLAHLRSCAACTLYMSIDRTSLLAQYLGRLIVKFLNFGDYPTVITPDLGLFTIRELPQKKSGSINVRITEDGRVSWVLNIVYNIE